MRADMKITGLRTVVVNVPIDPPILTAIFEIRSAACVLRWRPTRAWSVKAW